MYISNVRPLNDYYLSGKATGTVDTRPIRSEKKKCDKSIAAPSPPYREIATFVHETAVSICVILEFRYLSLRTKTTVDYNGPIRLTFEMKI